MSNNYEYIVSSCLCGVKSRYDGKVFISEKVKELVDSGKALMVCPEIMGGLEVPRLPCEIIDNKIINSEGEDKTRNFKEGADKVLSLAKKYNIKKAILKEKSPSCGSNYIYDGTFNKNLIEGEGITAKLLRQNGIIVISSEEFI